MVSLNVMTTLVGAVLSTVSAGGALPITPYSEAEIGMLRAGGLIPYLRQRLGVT